MATPHYGCMPDHIYHFREGCQGCYDAKLLQKGFNVGFEHGVKAGRAEMLDEISSLIGRMNREYGVSWRETLLDELRAIRARR